MMDLQFFTALIATSFLFPAFAEPIPQPSLLPSKVTPTLSLLEAVQKNSTGLNSLSEKERAQWIKQAQLYAAVRHTGAKTPEQKKWMETCDDEENSNPFCTFLEESTPQARKKPSHLKSSATAKRKLRSKEIEKWIQTGAIDKLSSLTDSEIRGALKKINTPDPLSLIAQSLLAEPECKLPRLAFLIGNKSEEFLPDPQFRSQAIQLYRKAAPCGESEASSRAKFRLSLLQIWEGDCKASLPLLKSLANPAQANDYQSRALFWQYHCGTQLKDEKTTTEAKTALMEKYPFSLHTLLVNKGEKLQQLPETFPSDTTIQLRTDDKEDLNQRISAIEALIQIRETPLARESMSRLFSYLEGTSPEFRIYAAFLYHRVEDYLKKFQILNTVFRDSPKTLSRSVVELYYSQNSIRLSTLAKLEIDQTLLMSLIRQESAFNTNARSPAGAMGLMQVMPHTARRIARIRRNSELLNPVINVRVGSKYFSKLMENYNGDAELALAAYNAGPKRVDEWLKRYPVKDRILFLDLVPFKETREYVASIARHYFWYSAMGTPESLKAETEATEAKNQSTSNLSNLFNLFGS